MEYILDGFKEAITLIISGDAEVYKIIGFSLIVSLTATMLSLIVGIPIGIITGIKAFRGKDIYVRIVYTAMGLPPVVVGLLIALFLGRRGPLGQLQLMYTPIAMVIAQTILVTPIVIGNVYNHSNTYGKTAYEVCKTLGGHSLHQLLFLVSEIRVGIFLGMTAGFGRAISEVGAIMIVGGNIKGYTRVMTTYIAMNNSMGNYGASIAMGMILLLLAFLLNGCMYYLIERNHKWK